MAEGFINQEEELISLQSIYSALGHAIRYDIITYLGAFHRPVQYSELVEWLNIKPGSFYFHMKKLENLVDQNEDKMFYLTPSGYFALDLVKSGESLKSNLEKSSQKSNDVDIILPKRFSIILFGELLRRLTFNTRFKIIMVLIAISQIVLLETSKLGAIPFFFDGNLYFGPIMCAIQLILSVLIIWVLLELITSKFSPIKGFSNDLLFAIPLAMFPLFIYPFLVIIAGNFEFPALLLSNETISIILIFVLQIVSSFFIIQLLQVIKSINFERALIPVFITLYGFSILSFVLSSTGIL